MFDHFPKSKFDLITMEGELRAQIDAIATGAEIIIPDEAVIVQPGDEMRRRLPNGTDEAFEVVDPVFVQATFGIPGHFQVQVRKKGVFPRGSGGNYTINVSGSNSRVNIGSSDHSSNVVVHQRVFSEVRDAIDNQVANAVERTALLDALTAMERAQGSSELGTAYQRFIAGAANHMTVIAPFLPAFGQMFGG